MSAGERAAQAGARGPLHPVKTDYLGSWAEEADHLLNARLGQALKVRYELEVSRRKALESELDRAILLAASSAASTPNNSNNQQHKLQGTPNARWATQRSTNDSCCNNSSSSNVNRAAAGEPGTVQSPYATCSCGKVSRTRRRAAGHPHLKTGINPGFGVLIDTDSAPGVVVDGRL